MWTDLLHRSGWQRRGKVVPIVSLSHVGICTWPLDSGRLMHLFRCMAGATMGMGSWGLGVMETSCLLAASLHSKDSAFSRRDTKQPESVSYWSGYYLGSLFQQLVCKEVELDPLVFPGCGRLRTLPGAHRRRAALRLGSQHLRPTGNRHQEQPPQSCANHGWQREVRWRGKAAPPSC